MLNIQNFRYTMIFIKILNDMYVLKILDVQRCLQNFRYTMMFTKILDVQ